MLLGTNVCLPQVLRGIELLKLQGDSWLRPWQRRVEAKRAAEMRALVQVSA